jgi:hypothetical protein
MIYTVNPGYPRYLTSSTASATTSFRGVTGVNPSSSSALVVSKLMLNGTSFVKPGSPLKDHGRTWKFSATHHGLHMIQITTLFRSHTSLVDTSSSPSFYSSSWSRNIYYSQSTSMPIMAHVPQQPSTKIPLLTGSGTVCAIQVGLELSGIQNLAKAIAF